jgi:hypothetical protein
MVVLQSFLERLFPQGFLLFRPGQDVYYGEECLSSLREDMALADISAQEPKGLPAQAFVFHYPPGEQDNVLTCCVLLRNLYQTLYSDVPLPLSIGMATRALGPAYFFALTAMTEMVAGGNPQNYRLPVLCSTVLREEGWFDHPQIGPLLEALKARYEVYPNAVDPTQSPDWKSISAQATPYLPSDYDKDAPKLWARLRQLLPPNDLDINAVESRQPADTISILNAGWAFYLLAMEDLYKTLGSKTPQDKFEAKMVLNRLLTKGVELSQISQRWREARKAAER